MSKKIVDSTLHENVDLKAQINEAGKIVAESYNKPLKDIYEDIQADINSKNPVSRERGVRAAAQFTNQLMKLVLRQTMDIIELSEKENKIISKFQNYEMGEGNTYQFILDLNTGVDSYHKTPFIPEDYTDPQIEVKNCSWLKENGDLNDWSFQFHKPMTLAQHEWLPFFKTNTLSQFVGRIRAQMSESITLMKRAKIQKFIKELPIGKQITGAVSNVDCYDSFLELIDLIDTVQFDTNEYCLSAGTNKASKNIKAAKKSDLILLINKKTLNLLRTGIKARLTNPGAFDLSSVIDMDNVVEFYKMINDNVDSKTVITTSNDSVVEPNTIIVLDKKALILINKLEFYGEQLYNKNMAIELDLHYWFMLDYLPWRKGFKFTDNKLTVVPQ